MGSAATRAMIRQGDVLLIPVDPPANPVRVMGPDGQPLAGIRIEGERTGHAHELRCRVYDDADIPGRRLGMLERPEPMTHQEHDHVHPAAGWWEVRVQREYVAPKRHANRRD